ncbi:hypothetical protein ES703_92684 [subsurface metagenome]
MTLEQYIKTYRLYNRITKSWWEGQAASAQEACLKAGWLIGDTWVRVRTPVIHSPTSESGHTGGGLADITPKELLPNEKDTP